MTTYDFTALQQFTQASASDLTTAIRALGLDERSFWDEDDVTRIVDQLTAPQSQRQQRTQQQPSRQSNTSMPTMTGPSLPMGIGGSDKSGKLAGAAMATRFVGDVFQGYGEAMVGILSGQPHEDPDIAAIQQSAFEKISQVNSLMGQAFFGSSPELEDYIPRLPAPATNQLALPGQLQ